MLSINVITEHSVLICVINLHYQFTNIQFKFVFVMSYALEYAVAHLFEALNYNLESQGFDSR